MCGGPFALGAFVTITAWGQLPADIAVHWTASGEANSFDSPPVAVTIFGLLAAIFTGAGVSATWHPLLRKAQVAVAVFSGFAGLLVGTWCAIVRTAVTSAAELGPGWWFLLAGVAWGAATYVVLLPLRNAVEADEARTFGVRVE